MELVFKQQYETWVAQGCGVSFKGQGLKLDTAQDGEPIFLYFLPT